MKKKKEKESESEKWNQARFISHIKQNEYAFFFFVYGKQTNIKAHQLQPPRAKMST
jgi:hypothetical protein